MVDGIFCFNCGRWHISADTESESTAPEQASSVKKASSAKKGDFHSLDRRDTQALRSSKSQQPKKSKQATLLGSSASMQPKKTKQTKQLECAHPLDRTPGQPLPAKRKRQQSD